MGSPLGKIGQDMGSQKQGSGFDYYRMPVKTCSVSHLKNDFAADEPTTVCIWVSVRDIV